MCMFHVYRDVSIRYSVTKSGHFSVALFPGVEEGEEKERLVHTVCACT